MRLFINRICYLVLKGAKGYLKERRLQKYNEIATIDKGVIIGENSKINNNRQKADIQIGTKTILEGELLTFKHGGRIQIGNCCYIGERSKIWSAKNITIGNRVLIAHNVNIHDQNSHPLDSKARHLDQMHIMEKGFQDNINLHEAEIIINDDAWIGFNSTILKGVTIGRGAIVGACTLITENVPDFAVVVGTPARIIKYTT